MRIVSLLKAKLEGTTFLGGGIRRLRDRNQLWIVPIAVLGIAVGLVGIITLLYQNYRAMAIIGQAMGAPALPLTLAVVVTWVLTFVLGFPIAISVLYLSRDTRLLATLPIPAYRIVGANAGLLYLYALPVAILLFVPALVAGYGGVIAAGAPPLLFWTSSVLITLALPIVPLALSVLVVTVITRLVNLSRYRTGLEALGMVLIVVLLVGFQLALSRTMMAQEEGVPMTEALRSVVESVRGAVPPAQWYAQAFVPGGAVALVLSLIGTVGIGVVAISAVQAGYLRQLSNQTVTHTRRRRSTPGTMPNQHPPVVSLVMREIKLLTSNSTFLFESAGEVFVFPIILLILRVATPGEVLNEVRPFLEQSDYLLPIVTGALVLFAGINSVSSAALSREGKSFDLSLSLPLNGATQVGAKILTYLVLFGSAFLVNSILAVWILARPWWTAVAIFLTGLPFIWLIGVSTIYTDLRRPLLTWNHPQQAVKQNLNVVLGMGVAIVSVGVTAAPAIVAAARGASAGVVMVLAAGLAVVVAAVVGRTVLRYADRRYAAAFA
jgi:ABC-2 type transport system permease protein